MTAWRLLFPPLFSGRLWISDLGWCCCLFLLSFVNGVVKGLSGWMMGYGKSNGNGIEKEANIAEFYAFFFSFFFFDWDIDLWVKGGYMGI